MLEGKIVDRRAQQLLFWVHVSELNSAVCQRLNQTFFLGGGGKSLRFHEPFEQAVVCSGQADVSGKESESSLSQQ